MGLAAAEIDEDRVRGGSESVIKLPKHLAEKGRRGRGKRNEKKGGGSQGH